METLQRELERPALRSWLGLQTNVNIMKLDACHAWRAQFTGQRVGLSGGLKDDATANHCFVHMLRRGSAATPNPEDTISHRLFCKRFRGT